MKLSCPLLQKWLGDSLISTRVVEISGGAGAGKTQLALTLMADAITRESQYVFYVCTEGAFPMSRFEQIMHHRLDNDATEEDTRLLMDKAQICHVTELDDLMLILSVKLPALLDNFRSCMLILDSVAAPLRSEFDISTERTAAIVLLGQTLHGLARRFGLVIVCLNQVTAYLDQPQYSFGRSEIPALGLLWANHLNCRVFIERTDLVISPPAGQVTVETRLRKLTTDFSSFLPSSHDRSGYFVVDDTGVRGILIR